MESKEINATMLTMTMLPIAMTSFVRSACFLFVQLLQKPMTPKRLRDDSNAGTHYCKAR